jgi:hypothetical protein
MSPRLSREQFQFGECLGNNSPVNVSGTIPRWMSREQFQFASAPCAFVRRMSREQFQFASAPCAFVAIPKRCQQAHRI